MKTYMPAILVLLILGLLVGVGFLTADLLVSPEAAFNQQVDQKVERAERLLAQYEGGQPLLLAALERLSAVQAESTTQPAIEEPLPDDAAGGEKPNLLREQQQDLDRHRDELRQKLVNMGGDTQTAAAEFDSEEDLRRLVQANVDLLTKALAATREAIGTSEGEFSGSSHPVATRLEAMLIYHQVDLRRRQASIHRAHSDVHRGEFNQVLLTWREADNRVKALQTELNGTTGAPAEGEAVPSMDGRIEQLQAKARETDTQIAEARQEVDRLSAAVAEVKGKLDQARSRADAATRRMMELEDAGIDASDPDAIKRFTEAYNQAARTEREASREADALEYGILRNARPEAQEENEILTAPLVPAQAGQEITPQLGLVALEADLRAAKALLETRQALRKQIDAQIKVLETRRDQLKADLAKAESWRDSLVKEATGRAQAAIAEAIAAEKLENEAIAKVTEEGLPAAERAEGAANRRGSEIQDFHRQQMAGSPATGFMTGYVQTVAGDLELERALLLAQQAQSLNRHEPLLAALVQMGIDPGKLAVVQAGEDSSAEAAAMPAGTPTTQPQGIAEAANAARTQALEAAKAALKHYEDASGQLNRLWLVHTQMAAVHYLMASLTTGDEAQKHRANAAREYQLATRDRPDRPESKAYRFVTEAPR